MELKKILVKIFLLEKEDKLLRIEIRENGLNLEGYINVSERPSKPLRDSEGQFIEVVREARHNRTICIKCFISFRII